jgi:methionyl-tRNA formyltransferase
MSSEGSRPRVVLLGMGPTAATALEALRARFAVVAIVRDVDDGVAGAAREGGADVSTDVSIAGVTSLIDRVRPDCVVVSSYTRILPAPLVARRPFVNVHYAPLPRYRGRATVNWALINGEREAAITIHSLVPGLDAGGILYQRTIPIGPADTVTSLYERLNELQRRALAAAVARRLTGDEGSPQEECAATYACTRLPEDGEIDWSAPNVEVDRLVRALAEPYPGAFTFLGLRRLWVRRAAPLAEAPPYEGRIPGRVVRVSKAEGSVDVLTGDGVLRLCQVELEGEGGARPASEVVRSVRTTLGLRTADLVERIAALERALAELRG